MARGEIGEQVRDLAAERGVSERTVRRWFQKMRTTGTTYLLEPRRCDYCDSPLPEHATARRRFCDGTCRQHAYRRRLEQQRRTLYRAQPEPDGQPLLPQQIPAATTTPATSRDGAGAARPDPAPPGVAQGRPSP